jgi:phage terminase large subunit-like protein
VPGAQIVIISKDKDAAVNFHTYVRNILWSVRENNPNAPKIIKDNERVTTNSLGNKISSLAASKESGRSFSATHLYFDELAFVQYAEEIWQAASATLAQTGGRVTAISTPKRSR